MNAYPLRIEEDLDYVFNVNGVKVYVSGPVSVVMKKISKLSLAGSKIRYIGKGKWSDDENTIRDSS